MISEQYCLIPGDLREFHQDLAARLLEVLDPGIPTLFLAECVFIYLDPQHSSNILRWMTEHFGQAGSMTILYDPVGLADNFGKVMVNNLQVRFVEHMYESALTASYRLEGYPYSGCPPMPHCKPWRNGSRHTASAMLTLKASRTSVKAVSARKNSDCTCEQSPCYFVQLIRIFLGSLHWRCWTRWKSWIS